MKAAKNHWTCSKTETDILLLVWTVETFRFSQNFFLDNPLLNVFSLLTKFHYKNVLKRGCPLPRQEEVLKYFLDFKTFFLSRGRSSDHGNLSKKYLGPKKTEKMPIFKTTNRKNQKMLLVFKIPFWAEKCSVNLCLIILLFSPLNNYFWPFSLVLI